jgi:hypothetical protein
MNQRVEGFRIAFKYPVNDFPVVDRPQAASFNLSSPS